MEKSATSGLLGCGSDQTSEITLNIQTTTGGNFFITVDDKNTVEQLKKIVSKKLKVSKDRICLLHRERQLRDGTLKENGLVEGSRVILLPSVETGLLTQRPENSVMQALESLNDSQVNDFLSGKSPLNLTMRLGDHMMLIQLQLSTLNPGNSTSGAGSSKMRSNSSASRTRSSTTSSAVKERKFVKEITPKSTENLTEGKKQQSGPVTPPSAVPQTSQDGDRAEQSPNKNEDFKSFLRKQDIETLQNAIKIFKSFAEMQEGDSPQPAGVNNDCLQESDNTMSAADLCCSEQSPIKSLSNLVSSPIKSSDSSDSDTPGGSNESSSTTYVPLPTSLHSNLIENLMSKCEETHPADTVASTKPQAATPQPQYVPLPSSLKNNLIESLVGGSGSVKSDTDNVMCTDSVITDPIAANLTSCLCSTFNNTDYPCATNCHTSPAETQTNTYATCDAPASDLSSPTSSDSNPGSTSILCDETIDYKQNIDTSSNLNKDLNKNKRLHYLLHKTSKLVNPITRSKQKAFMQSVVNKHVKKRSQLLSSQSKNESDVNVKLDQPESGHHMETSSNSDESVLFKVPRTPSPNGDESLLFKVPKPPATNRERRSSTSTCSNSDSDTKALIEASKNLTQTLKKLSKEVLTNKVDLTDEDSTRAKIGQGAVIESMKHHGKGIYSGTFSGTLNPALQDRFGRPKRDISTIIHILNDLLCATPPQYRRGARITFEPTHNTNSSKNKQNENKEDAGATCPYERSECTCNKCTDSTCPYGECDGHLPLSNGGKSCLCREPCNCNRSLEHSIPRRKCMNCSDKSSEDKITHISNKNCKKCNLASALALENSKTKCKLDQLRLVMQQKKQKREERKLKAAPYVATGSSVTPLQTESTSPPVLPEEIDTLA